MYIIEFYRRNGAVDWLANQFRTKREAHRFAKLHWRLIGTDYILRRLY